jgi:hypothetical protein
LAPETKPSWFARISAWLQRLREILASFWAAVLSLFSRLRAPHQDNIKETKEIAKLSGRAQSAAKSRMHNKGKGQLRPPRTEKSVSKILLEATLAMLTVLAFLIALLTLFPRVTVSNEAPIDPDDAFSTPFVVSNDGYLPLYSLQFSVAMGDVKYQNGSRLVGPPDFGFHLTTPEWKIASLYPAKKFTVYAGRVLGAHGNLKSADIAIVVDYRPMLWPFRRESVYVLKTGMGYDGRLHWLYSN